MSHHHTCDLLKEWTADPRSPIKRNTRSAGYVLIVNPESRVVIAYCPFCGEKISGTGELVSQREHLCKHLPELSRDPESSVRYRRDEREYWLFGSDSLMIRLFYCPLCGCKLLLHKNDRYFYKKAPAEVAELAKQIQKITTIDLAIEQFGPPDVQHGRLVDYAYPKGKRTRIGHKRALFYDHLARTVTVAVIEGLDGRVEVKLYPKERTR